MWANGRECHSGDLVKPMNSREILEQEIKYFEEQLKPRKAALKALIELETMSGLPVSPETRYVGARPLDAMREILTARGKPMPREELKRMLIAGGLTYGKKRPERNIDVSLKVNIKTGNLTHSAKDDMIGLPEWKKG